MKAIEQYFHVVLFIMLYKVVLTFKSVDETLVCDHSNESYRAVLSSGAVCFWQLQETEEINSWQRFTKHRTDDCTAETGKD